MASIKQLVEQSGLTLDDVSERGPHSHRYELLTPQGKCFEQGRHGEMCWDAKEVRAFLKTFDQTTLENCPADCDCRA